MLKIMLSLQGEPFFQAADLNFEFARLDDAWPSLDQYHDQGRSGCRQHPGQFQLCLGQRQVADIAQKFGIWRLTQT